MRKHFTHLSFFFTFACSQVFAQNTKPLYHFIGAVGIAGGNSPVAFICQNINGFSIGQWYAGIGIGLDTYQYNTLPVFLDLRKFFGPKSKVFLYGDVGSNIPFNNKPAAKLGVYHTYNFKGGLYTDFGFGYKTHFINKTSFIFTIGHTYKQVITNTGIANDCIGCTPQFYNYEFGYGRIILKAGMMF